MTAQFGKLLKRFRKQSLLDRVVVSAFVIASVIYGGTKSPTNNPPPRMNAPRPVTQNDIANGDENFGVPSQGTVLTDNGSGNDEFPNIRSLTPDDYDAGVVLARIGTNEVFDFSVPEGAVVCEDRQKFGAVYS